MVGRVMNTLSAKGKHEYLKNLAQNVVRGMRKAMEQGSAPPRPTYGYNRLAYDPAGKLMQRIPMASGSASRTSGPSAWPRQPGESSGRARSKEGLTGIERQLPITAILSVLAPAALGLIQLPALGNSDMLQSG